MPFVYDKGSSINDVTISGLIRGFCEGNALIISLSAEKHRRGGGERGEREIENIFNCVPSFKIDP